MHTSAPLTTHSVVPSSIPERAVARLSAAVLLVLSTPLLLLIALLIWSEDRGPVVFAHYRIGRNGRPFQCYKFRTMVINADVVLRELLGGAAGMREEWQGDQ